MCRILAHALFSLSLFLSAILTEVLTISYKLTKCKWQISRIKKQLIICYLSKQLCNNKNNNSNGAVAQLYHKTSRHLKFLKGICGIPKDIPLEKNPFIFLVAKCHEGLVLFSVYKKYLHNLRSLLDKFWLVSLVSSSNKSLNNVIYLMSW